MLHAPCSMLHIFANLQVCPEGLVMPCTADLGNVDRNAEYKVRNNAHDQDAPEYRSPDALGGEILRAQYVDRLPALIAKQRCSHGCFFVQGS